MTTTARVVVLPQHSSELEIETLELPEPSAEQVVVKQFASGICHSQLHQIHRPRQSPVILGHESTGVVTKAGSAVTHLAPGDMAMVTWVPRNIQSESKPPVAAQLEVSEGIAKSQNVFTWADHTIADQQYVVKVDPNVDKDVTAIIGCAVMTGAGAVINTANVQKGESVAIFGVGGVGLSAVVGARMAGADPIIAVDLDDQKLAFAKQFGATPWRQCWQPRSGCRHSRTDYKTRSVQFSRPTYFRSRLRVRLYRHSSNYGANRTRLS